jgi:uncharacterized protein (TIGR01244 family)
MSFVKPFAGLALPAFLVSIPLFAGGPQAPGVPHFFAVDEHVYRGGQPTEEGWTSLAKLGVKTVIDLRREGEDNEHSIAAERRAVEAAGMHYVNVPMKSVVAPPETDMVKILSVLNSGAPVFVHCKKGMDRTGTVIACYRVAQNGWSNHKALQEAEGLGIHWYEVGMKQYIRTFQPESSRAQIEAGVTN